MSTKKKSKGPDAPPRPSWIPDWTDSDAYAIPSHKLPFSLHIIAFDFLRRNPDYIRDYAAFKALTVSKQSEHARALCDKYAIADGWPPDPAIDPRSDTQSLPIYRHSFYPRLITRLPGAPDVAEIWTAPGDMLVTFSSHLPLDKQLKAASAWLRERLNKAQSDDRPKMHREVDRLVIDLRLLDARLNGVMVMSGVCVVLWFIANGRWEGALTFLFAAPIIFVIGFFAKNTPDPRKEKLAELARQIVVLTEKLEHNKSIVNS